MKNIVKFLFFFLFLSISLPLYGGDGRIDIELWCELDPLVPGEGQENPIPRAVALDRMLEEARIIFSYMIYGGTFQYTPYDKIRKVEEQYNVSPVYEIRWGDKNLKILASRLIKNRLFANIRYALEDYQKMRLDSWKSNINPPVTGRGEANLFMGYTYKRNALENAIKEAVRNHLRKRIYNKPKQISGDFLLTKYPDIIIKAGKYIATAKIKLYIKKIIPYKNF